MNLATNLATIFFPRIKKSYLFVFVLAHAGVSHATSPADLKMVRPPAQFFYNCDDQSNNPDKTTKIEMKLSSYSGPLSKKYKTPLFQLLIKGDSKVISSRTFEAWQAFFGGAHFLQKNGVTFRFSWDVPAGNPFVLKDEQGFTLVAHRRKLFAEISDSNLRGDQFTYSVKTIKKFSSEIKLNKVLSTVKNPTYIVATEHDHSLSISTKTYSIYDPEIHWLKWFRSVYSDRGFIECSLESGSKNS